MAWQTMTSNESGATFIIPTITSDDLYPQIIAEVDQAEHAELLASAPDMLDALRAIADFNIDEANAQMAGDAIAIASHVLRQMATE